MTLSNKAIVVTGASSGMGKAIVEMFVKEGASVIAVARRTERLMALTESLAGEAGKIVPFTGDVSKKEDCANMTRQRAFLFVQAAICALVGRGDSAEA